MNYFGSRPAGLNYWTGRTEAHSHDDILGIPEISGAPNMPAISPEVSSGYFGDPYAKDDTPTTGGGGGGGGPGSLAAGALAFGPTLLSGANTLSKFATDKSLLEHGADLLRPDPVNGIIQNNPIESAMDLFGFGPQSARAELTTALHPTGDIGNISGLPFDGGGATGLGVVVVVSCIQGGTREDSQADSATTRTARQDARATRGTKRLLS